MRNTHTKKYERCLKALRNRRRTVEIAVNAMARGDNGYLHYLKGILATDHEFVRAMTDLERYEKRRKD